MNTVWFWCSLSYATFGVGLRDGKVVETAAINRWMLGKDAATVKRWLDKKGAVIKPIPVKSEERTEV